MNFLLAIVIFYIVIFALGFKVSLPLIVDHKFQFANQSTQVFIGEVAKDSPAEKAGIAIGDSIVKIDGRLVRTVAELQEIVRSSEGKQLEVVLENPINNKKRIISVTPVFREDLKAPALGIGLDELAVLNYETPAQKIFSGFGHSWNTLAYSGKIFAKIIGFSIRERDITPVSEGVSGPVGIASLTSQAVKYGPIPVLQLAGLLSLNLAVINILPIPALDGGRFFFLIFEAITRRKPNPTLEKWVHTVGFVLLLGLIVLVTYNDIVKLLK